MKSPASVAGVRLFQEAAELFGQRGAQEEQAQCLLQGQRPLPVGQLSWGGLVLLSFCAVSGKKSELSCSPAKLGQPQLKHISSNSTRKHPVSPTPLLLLGVI